MAQPAELTESEIRDFAVAWYRKLDTHDPLVEFLPLLAEEGLEMVFPEGTVQGHAGFEGWFERVIRIFFDEEHTVKEVKIVEPGERPRVKVVVNWQAHTWDPPAAKSKWLGFDAYQTWVVQRSAVTGKPVIRTYIVDELKPMPGSPNL
jgi:hypothetical protein